MRVPLGWLREYVAVPADASGEKVAADLVRVGLEEEAVHGGDVTGPLLVGRVLDFADEPQRNGKTIRWCQVDVGEPAPRGVVCGALNFSVGDLVVVVLPGAVLPGGYAITARKTYGHVSDGMICSVNELGIGQDAAGILRLAEIGLDDAEVGADAIALLGLGEETVEVNVTPDRGYCLSVRGVAREYSHATGAPFTDPALIDVPAPTANGFAVELDDDAPIRGYAGCDRYVARVVRDVDPNRPAPRWMQQRLEQAGMRPISLAVDVTNYVMLAVGQPLHAFDLAKLQAPIVVRRARAGERLTTLDEIERVLDPEDLLITDAGGERVLALAGVMGGADSEIDRATTDVLIEAAHFDPVTVARTGRRHKLATEASRRFERGVDSDLAAVAAELATRLLVEHGGGSAAEGSDADERLPVAAVRMPADLPSRIVGREYSPQEVRSVLTMIGCDVREEGDILDVLPPTWRPDLRAGIDLVEEVARLQGYDLIPSVLPTAPAGTGLTPAQRSRRSVARALAEHGLVEVLSYPFVSPQVHDAMGLAENDARRRAVRLANPLSDEQPEMRTSLLAPLLDTLRRNIGRGATDVALFEIGLVVNPDPWQPAAPRIGAESRPDDSSLRALYAAVPPQPRHVAVVLAGLRVPSGWYGPGRSADWTDAVDAALHVGRTLGLDLTVRAGDQAPWHPGRCAVLELAGDPNPVVVGVAGELHPKVVTALSLPPRTVAAEVDLDALIGACGAILQAVPVSAYPLAKEDVALVVDADVPAAVVQAALVDGGGDLLESVRLFDVYVGPQIGEGRKSLAFALRLRAPDRTLTAKQTASVRDAAVDAARRATGAVLRGA